MYLYLGKGSEHLRSRYAIIFCHFITERYPMSHLVVYLALPVDRAVREEI